MGKGGLFYIYIGYFGSSTSKDVTFLFFTVSKSIE